MWELVPNSLFRWFHDEDECLVYVEATGETILVNQIAFQVIQWMHDNPTTPLVIEQLPKILNFSNSLYENDAEVCHYFQNLMRLLSGYQIVKRVSN